MTKLTRHELNHVVTGDLIRKVSDDVSAAIRRTLAIAPQPYLPLLLAAGGICAGMMAAELAHKAGVKRGSTPDPDCVILAGLLIARSGIGGTDPIGDAYRDFDALKAAGRTAKEDTRHAE